MIYVLHENGAPIDAERKKRHWKDGSQRVVRRNLKAYTSERNARIAIGQRSGNVEVVPYVPLTDFLAMAEIARSEFVGDNVEWNDMVELLEEHGYTTDSDGHIVKEDAV